MSARAARCAALAVAAALPFAATSCQGSDGGEPTVARPTLSATKCPPVVDDVLISHYSCATLSTRGDSDASSVKLLVTTVEPADGAASPDPVIVVGEDLATTLNYAGLAPAAERLQRTLVLLNPRGVAGSEPDLSCPEVDALGPVAPAGGTDAWVDAVDRCATRLADAGVDVTAFGQAQMAADVLALVDALGAETWNLGSWGSSGRVALEVMRSDPPGLRSVFVDSPELPADDTLSAAPGRTASALDRVLRSCADQPGCRSLPHSSEDVDRIAAALDAQPVEVTVEADGGPVTVPVDGALLVRLLRHMLSNNGVASQFYAANAIPAALAAADDRDPAALAILVEPMLTSAAYCEGFVPTCPPYHRITLGAYLETVCSHAGPPTAQPGVPASIRSTFDADPYRLACDRWPFQSAADNKPLVSDVPVLLMAGAWDPYVDPAPRSRWKDELAGLSRLTVVEVPGWGHNVLSSGACAQAMRNGFVAAPERSVDQSCLASLPTTPDFLPHL